MYKIRGAIERCYENEMCKLYRLTNEYAENNGTEPYDGEADGWSKWYSILANIDLLEKGLQPTKKVLVLG